VDLVSQQSLEAYKRVFAKPHNLSKKLPLQSLCPKVSSWFEETKKPELENCREEVRNIHWRPADELDQNISKVISYERLVKRTRFQSGKK